MVRVNITAKKKEAAWDKFAACLTDEEEEAIRTEFEQYLFYDGWGQKNYRECFCTRCRSSFSVYKNEDKDFFKLKHNDDTRCPYCGEKVQLKCSNKCKTFRSLDEVLQCAVIRLGPDGALLISHGLAIRTFNINNLHGEIEWEDKRRYYLAPGEIGCWTRSISLPQSAWVLAFGQTGDWEERKTCVKPFPDNWMYNRDSSYVMVGAQNISKSALKYCQVEAWAEDQMSVTMDDDTARCRLITQYLAEAAVKKQIEMIVKMGLYKVVTDLLLGQSQSGLRWNAKTPWGFFGLQKQDWGVLKKEQLSMELIGMVQEGISARDAVQLIRKMSPGAASKLHTCAKELHISVNKALRYIESLNAGKTAEVVQIWEDYLRMAKMLQYDMTRQDVTMPKKLHERHDAAAETVKINEAELQSKAYKKRYEKLRRKYEFSYAGLTVVVPKTAQEIIQEGKTLKICVGGYAPRHMDGRTTILFIRKKRTPERSLYSIEMGGTQGDQIIQTHGYRNEACGQDNPRIKHREFFAVWTDWIKGGSRRDKQGRPIIEMEATA